MKLRERAHEVWSLIKEAGSEWSDDNASRLAASLAFYTLLSIAPLVVLAIFVAGLAYGEEAARGQVATQLSSIVGPHAALGIQAIVENARAPGAGWISSVLGIVVLIFGGSAMFIELRSALNEIWEVPPEPSQGFWAFLRQRLLSFSMVMGVALLLFASTLLSAALSALGHFAEQRLPGGEALWQLVDLATSLGMLSLVFAALFKYLPDVSNEWRDVWLGASVTALLFAIGKFLIGLYLGKSSISSAYGAAGSFVMLILWVYYSAQIVFFGAELTFVWSRRRLTAA